MYYQNSKQANPFRHYGCYFFSLGKIAEKVTKTELSKMDIFETFTLACENGWMKPDCYIYSAGRVLQYFLDILSEPGKWDADYVGCWNKDKGAQFWAGDKYNYTVERYDYGAFLHFKLNDWDPHVGVFEQANRGLTGYRYFLITEGSQK